ncbi:MAG: 50S ribosomal protein L13 [Phycisphaerae bacterium]|nr:50S ribosomal protein L13 [Phycisphaerae bacterium]
MRRETTWLKTGRVSKNWRIVDAEGKPLGRLAVDIANVLMGKHRPDYTPHVDCGDFVIVTNASKVELTGRKAEQKMRRHYTGYPDGLKMESYGQVRQRRPQALIEDAVRRMLPKSRLGRVMLSGLKVYGGAEHPHASQSPTPL